MNYCCDGGKSGAGYVVRDHRGHLIAAGIAVTSQRISPSEAEAKAIIFGLRAAAALQLRKIEIQSDCHRVISMLQQNLPPATELGMLIEEIMFLRDSFEETHFSFLNRDCITPAHKLARYSLNFNYDVMWCNEAPPWLYTDLKADMPN